MSPLAPHDVPDRSRPPPIVALPTSIALFIGCAVAGPANVAVEVRSLADFETTFGMPDTSHAVGHSVGQFFDNGGVDAWVIALAAPVETDPSTAFGPGTTAFHAALAACCAPGGAVDAITRFDLLCVPGETDPATQALLQAQCAARDAFYLADCPADATATSLSTGADAVLCGAGASFSALYAPWVVAIDRSTGASRAFPPSGFIAGLYARVDAARGVWKAPAGIDATLLGALGLAVALTSVQSDAINEAGVDTIKAVPGHGIVAWGARTLASASGDAQYRYVPVRRLVSLIAASIRAGTAWAATEANGAPLWTTVRSLVGDFLMSLWRRGAFAGATPQQAFVVRCDATTMTQADLDDGRLVVELGVAPLRPAEFVVVRIELTACRPA